MAHNLTSHAPNQSRLRNQSRARTSTPVGGTTPREKCIARGGRWDSRSQTCITESETKEPKPKSDISGQKFVLGDKEVSKGEFMEANRVAKAQQSILEGGGRVALSPEEAALREQALEEGAEFVAGSGIVGQAAPVIEDIPLLTETQQEALPVLGPGVSVLRSIYQDAALKGQFGKRLQKEAEEQVRLQAAGASLETILGQDSVFLSVATKEVRQQVQQEGLNAASSFGAFVESIPVVGALARDFAPLIDTPSGTVRDIKTNIVGLREAAEFQVTQARIGNIPPEQAVTTILELQDLVIVLEARIRVVIQSSAILRANPEQVNAIESEIFRTKQKLFIAGRVAAASVVTEPNPDAVFLTLNELERGTT